MTEEPTDNGPLLNVAPKDEAPNAEAPIALRAEAAPEPSADDAAPAAERPEYIPAKFWNEKGADLEKLAKSYTELEKQFKSGKHKAPEQYDVNTLVDQGLDAEDPTMGVFQDWAKENGVSQAAFEDLAGKVLGLSKKEAEEIEVNRGAEMQKLGERAKEKIEMTERLLMKAPLTNSEREAMAMGLNNADAINAFIKYHKSLTNEGIPVTPTVNPGRMTRDDLESAISDPRWRTDDRWRSKIEKEWMASNN